MRRRAPVRALIPCLALALLAPAPAGAAFRFLKVGMEAPDVAVRALDGRELPLAEVTGGGRAALVVFWATWSPRAEPALREIEALHRDLAPKGLRAVAVNVDRQDPGPREEALVRQAAEAWGLTLPVALDPGLGAASAFGLVANPSVALLDGGGVLVWETSGWSRSSADACRERAEILLGVRAPAAAGEAQAPPPAHAPARKALLSFNLGRTFLRQGNAAKARGLLEAAAEADPAWAAPRGLLGQIALGDPSAEGAARAEALLREAARLDPRDVAAAGALGEALLRLGRLEDAEAELTRALALDPAYTPAVAARAAVLARRGRGAEAVALFDEALALNPRDAAVLAGRAGCREEAGDLAAAAGDYRSAAEILLGVR